MKVTLSKKDLREMVMCLHGTLEGGKGLPHKWKYALSKNIDKLESELKTIEKLIKPNNVFVEYEEKRIYLAETHAEKDANGQPLFIIDAINETRRYKITNIEAFNKELEDLRSLDIYKEVVKEQEYYKSPEFLEETEEYELHEIRVTKEENAKLDKGEIVIPGAAFRFTIKIMADEPELSVV